MVTENIKREEQIYGKMHDRKREFGERIQKNNSIFFKKNLTALWFSPQKTAWEWGFASFFACVGKTEKKY